MSLGLADAALKDLLPKTTKHDEQLAHAHMQGPVWGILAERTDLTIRTPEGLIVKSLLETLAGIAEAVQQIKGAKLNLQAATRMPDLTLTKHRDR